jgi:hypothetical protein
MYAMLKETRDDIAIADAGRALVPRNTRERNHDARKCSPVRGCSATAGRHTKLNFLQVLPILPMSGFEIHVIVISVSHKQRSCTRLGDHMTCDQLVTYALFVIEENLKKHCLVMQYYYFFKHLLEVFCTKRVFMVKYSVEQTSHEIAL